jgi:hypothetical protein
MTPRGPDNSKSQVKAPVFTEPHWTLFFDGSSCKQGAGAGVLLLTPSKEKFKYIVHLEFKGNQQHGRVRGPHLRSKYHAIPWGPAVADEG